jgi:hypothetical protein
MTLSLFRDPCFIYLQSNYVEKIHLFWFDTIYHFSPSYVIQYCRAYQLGAVARQHIYSTGK